LIPRRIFWLFDLAVLALAFLVAYALVPNLQPVITADGLLGSPWWQALGAPASWTGQLPPMRDLAWILAVTAPITLLTLEAMGNYRSLLNLSRTRVAAGGLLAPFVGLSFGALVMASLKANPVSRLFLFLFVFLSAVGLIFYRLSLRRYFLQRQAAGFYASNVLLVGLPDGIAWMARYFSDHVPQSGYRLAGFLSADHAEEELAGRVTAERPQLPLPSLGLVGQLGDLLINRPIHEVIAIQPTSGGEWIAQVVRDCDYFGILLRIVPEALLFGERHTLETLYPFKPLHLPAVVLTPPHWDSDALFLKRLFDIVVAGLLLLLLSPLIGIIALILKLKEPGAPVFYPWRVVGQNGVQFTGYKFRTMVSNADALKAELLKYNEMIGPVFKMKNDPRVTPVGRILRKFSLDELPQLWSVLKGDMSLVGPRPAGPHELARYEFWHKRKLSIRPGMTCLWQIRGRNAINVFDEWVKMDLEYIDKWSLWLDFKILAGTAWAVIAGTGV
jgi:exopolysaccharide biosynthesis polyprenyl glycosylphosphotransferase